jgi:hypothetical protein
VAFRIIPRSEWGARAPRSRTRITTPTPRLWIHHTGAEERGAAGMRAIQRYHMDTKRWQDIAYSFVIDDSTGAIYEGRGAGIAGGHTQGDNSRSHAICVMGNFQNRAPSAATLWSIVQLAIYGRAKGWWVPTLGGHRDAPGASTACPGQALYIRLPGLRSQVADEPEDDMTPDELAKELGTPGSPLRTVWAEIFDGQRELIKEDSTKAAQKAVDTVLGLYASTDDSPIHRIVRAELDAQ